MKYPKTRKEAIEEGSPRYNTGEECTNGHRADRYTQSGTCTKCVSMVGIKARYGSEVRKTEAVALREQQRSAVRDLVEVKLRCYMEHLDQLRAAVVAVTLARYPVLDRTQIISAKPPGANEGGTQLHRFNVSSQDVEMLRKVANAYLNTKVVNIQAHNAQRLAMVLKDAETEDNEEPAFDPLKA